MKKLITRIKEWFRLRKKVYINDGDSNKYHAKEFSHGMKDAIKLRVKEAEARGCVPCKNCFKNKK